MAAWLTATGNSAYHNGDTLTFQGPASDLTVTLKIENWATAGSVSDQTAAGVNWTADEVFRDLTPYSTSGSGEGMRITVTTDALGARTITLNDPGTGYQVGDTVSFAASGQTGNVTVRVDAWVLGNGTLSDQTPVGVNWTANATFRDLLPVGIDTGIRVTVTTDATGRVQSAVATHSGRGYAVGDTIVFAAPGQTGQIALKVDTVSVPVTISTEKANANAGTIWIGGLERTDPKDKNTVGGGRTILAGPFVQLLAQADITAGKKPGSVTLGVSDTAWRLFSWPFDFTSKDTRIELRGTTIKGGSVKLLATSNDLNLANDSNIVPSYLKGTVGTATNFLNQIPGTLISSLTGIDVSVVLREANAHISIVDSTVESTSSVDMSASTKLNTDVSAIAVGMGGPVLNFTGTEFAAGYGQATGVVEALVLGASSITAADNVRVRAQGDAQTNTISRASSNIVGPVNPDSRGIAIAIAYTELETLARVGRETAITALAGNVNVLSIGSSKAITDASTVSALDGQVGIGIGLSLDFSNARAFLDGDIRAGATQSGGYGKSFKGSDSSVVDLNANTISIPDHGFVTGQIVTYTPQSASVLWAPDPARPDILFGSVVVAGEAIGGLTAGSSYYVLVIDDDTIQLSKNPPLGIDGAGTDVTSTQTLQRVESQTFTLLAIDESNDTIRIAQHGFETGDEVKYDAGGNTAIGSLIHDGTYTVEKVDDTEFKLKDGNGNVVQLAQGASLGTHTFTRVLPGGVLAPNSTSVTLARVDPNTNTIFLKDHGFSTDPNNPTTINYSSLAEDGLNEIGGLENETEYVVQRINDNSFRLLDVTTGAVKTLSTPTGAADHGVSYLGRLNVFNPFTAVDGTCATITLPGHGLNNGDSVIYAVDPTKTTTQTVTQPDGTVLNIDALDPAVASMQNGKAYWVQKIDANTIRLVDDPLDVKAAAGIDLTSLPPGGRPAKEFGRSAEI